MTAALAVTDVLLAFVVGVLAVMFVRTRAELRRVTARTWWMPVVYASGALPPVPFDLDLGGERLVVVEVGPDSFRVRKRERHDRIAMRLRAMRRWLARPFARVAARWSAP